MFESFGLGHFFESSFRTGKRLEWLLGQQLQSKRRNEVVDRTLRNSDKFGCKILTCFFYFHCISLNFTLHWLTSLCFLCFKSFFWSVNNFVFFCSGRSWLFASYSLVAQEDLCISGCLVPIFGLAFGGIALDVTILLWNSTWLHRDKHLAKQKFISLGIAWEKRDHLKWVIDYRHSIVDLP